MFYQHTAKLYINYIPTKWNYFKIWLILCDGCAITKKRARQDRHLDKPFKFYEES